jgi:hypothetical protein
MAADAIVRDIADGATRVVDSAAGAFGMACENEQHVVSHVLTFQHGAIREIAKQ